MITKTLGLYKNALSGLSRDIWMLSIIMLINRSGMMVMPFMSIYLQKELGFSFTQTGLLLGFFGAGALLGTFSGGRLTDRIGYYPVMVCTLFFQGALFVVLLQAQSFWALGALMFITSAVGEAFRPANFVAIAAYSHGENRTRALGLQRLAVNLGMAIGPAIGGLIASKSGYGWLFWIDGITCMSAAALLRLTLKPKTVELQKTEKKVNGNSPYRDQRYLIFLFLVLLNAIAFFQLFTTLPIFLRNEIGLLESDIGQLIAFSCLLIVLLEMPLIYSIEKFWSKWTTTAIGALMVGCSFLLFNLLGWNWGVALIVMFVLTIGEILTLPFLSSLAMQRAEIGNKGDYMGLYTMVYSLAHIIAPNLGMFIASSMGFQVLWYVIGGMSVIALVGLIRMRTPVNKIVVRKESEQREQYAQAEA